MNYVIIGGAVTLVLVGFLQWRRYRFIKRVKANKAKRLRYLNCLKAHCAAWQQTAEHAEVKQAWEDTLDYWIDELKIKQASYFRINNNILSDYILFNENRDRAVILLYSYTPEKSHLYSTSHYYPAEKVNGVWQFFFIWGSIPMMAWHRTPGVEPPDVDFVQDGHLSFSANDGLIIGEECEINYEYIDQEFFPDNRWDLLEKFKKGEYPIR